MNTIEDVPGGQSAVGVPAPGYRMPSGLRLGKVSLQIADLERSLAYYTSVLGLQILRQAESSAVLGVGATEIVELCEKPGAVSAPRRGLLGLYHFAILLPERAALGRFLKHLGDLGERAGASDHLVSEALYLQDPDGLGIEIYVDRPRSGWAYDSARQLSMATKPLNAMAVVAAAGDESWSGMPAGTKLGHVHLHVGEIDQAAAFYHEALGLDKVVWDYPGALFLSAGGYHHHLGLNTWASGSRSAGADDAGLLEWEIVLPSQGDVDQALASLQAAGAAVERSGGSGAVRDPWGTRLRVLAG